MNDETKHHSTGKRRPPGVRRTVHPTAREVSLARLLLRIASRVASQDRDQEFLEVYNEVKMIAEPLLRSAIEGGTDGKAS